MFNPIRTIARQMLASMFIAGGIDALAKPEEKAPRVEDVVEPMTRGVPQLESLDTPEIVRLNGAVQVVGGLMLALGKAPRLASAALAATLVPTTLASHRFWEESDPEVRTNQQIHFTKNVSMLGGLLLAVLDKEGRPSVAWRTKHAVEHAGIHAGHAKRTAGLKTEAAVEKAKRATAETRAKGRKAAEKVALAAEHEVDKVGLRAELAKRKLTPDVIDAKRLVSAIRD